MSRAKTAWLITLVATVALVAVTIGCRGPEGAVGPAGSSPISVTGYVEWPYRHDTTGYVRVEVSNVPGIPTVYVNNIEIPFDMSEIFFYRDFPISPGDSARLRIEHTKQDGGPGVSEANVQLPALFTITSHDTSGADTIPYGEDLTIIWTSSAGADAYRASSSFHCRYEDTAGVQQDHDYVFTRISADTSITFLSSDIFPDSAEVGTVLYYSAHFSLSSLDGPWQEGEVGNITGDGIGTFHGRTVAGSLYLIATGN